MTILTIVWSDTLTLVAICFTMVLVIMFLFVVILKIFNVLLKVKHIEPIISAVSQPSITIPDFEINEMDSAAIATALYLYLDVQHDDDSCILTIKSIHQDYIPWNNNNIF